MSRDPQRLADYLGHVVEAIERIERYTADLDEVAFLHSEIVKDAVICNIERYHPGFAAAHPELPLAVAYEMRNALAHGYFKVDLGIVWRTVKRDLPHLLQLVRSLGCDCRACWTHAKQRRGWQASGQLGIA